MSLSKSNVKKIINPQVVLSIILQLSLILLSVAYPLLSPKPAEATLTTAFIRWDRMAAGAAIGGVVCMKSSITSGGVAKVFVQFPSTFSIAGANTTWTADTTAANLPNTSHGDAFTATAWPGIGAGPEAVAIATTTAIFTSSDLTVFTNTYCFHFTGGSSGSTTGTASSNLLGTVQTQTALGVPVETLNYATQVTTNTEQIIVSASVSAQFSFALSGGDPNHNLPLGALSSGSVTTAPYQVTATISTNAHNGFLSWVEGTNSDGLHSPTAGGTGITSPGSYPTVTDLASNTGYGIYAVTGTNSPTIAAGYTSANGTSVGHVDSSQFDLVSSLTGQQSGTTFLISARAKPLATQLAANDYSDTLTVVASGSF